MNVHRDDSDVVSTMSDQVGQRMVKNRKEQNDGRQRPTTRMNPKRFDQQAVELIQMEKSAVEELLLVKNSSTLRFDAMRIDRLGRFSSDRGEDVVQRTVLHAEIFDLLVFFHPMQFFQRLNKLFVRPLIRSEDDVAVDRIAFDRHFG